ncbi:hypothetical protein X801_09925, partial [Opisthorchis viverrini]
MLKDEMSTTLQQRGRKTWQQHLLTILRSHMMQIILSLLVLLDAGIVITEIVLEIQSLQKASAQLNHTLSKSKAALRRTRKYSTIILHRQRNGTHLQTFSEIRRQPRNNTTTSTTHNIALSEVQIDRSGEEHIFAHDPLSFTHGMNVDNSAQMMHEASEVLHYLSIAITGLFLICVIIKIICLKRKFLRDTN